MVCGISCRDRPWRATVLVEKYHGPYLRTHLHIRERARKFGSVDTTKGQFSILDQFIVRGLKVHRDDIGRDDSIIVEVVCGCGDGFVYVWP